MVSVLPSSTTLLPLENARLGLDELDNLRDAVEPFTKLIIRSGRRSFRLHCTIPTWSQSSDTCFDLHDLYDLRSRFLVFVHSVVESLHHSGITASYRLSPSNLPLCLMYALPPDLSVADIKTTAIDVLENTKNIKRECVVVVGDLKYGPAVIIT